MEAVENRITAVTPSGVEIAFEWAPKRKYLIRWEASALMRHAREQGDEWREVPSVTTVLGVLDKPALPWWGMRVGVEGVLALMEQNKLNIIPGRDAVYLTDAVIRFLTQEKLTVNHVRDKAGDRGLSIHDAFENWAKTGVLPHPEIYPPEQQGYVAGLRRFMDDFSRNGATYPKAEVMVGSLEHGFAGRYDLRIDYWGGPLVTKCYAKRADKLEDVPEGKYLIDLKTSSGVYPSHALQLAAYEGASVECGYPATDYRAVVHVTQDGKYEFVRTDATLDEFLAVRRVYDALVRLKGKTA